MAAAVLTVAVSLSACTTAQGGNPEPWVEVPPDAPMEDVLAETIDEYRPAGVAFDVVLDIPAEEVGQFNVQKWKFIAPDEAALVTAAQDLHEQAVGEGWVSGGPFEDPGGSGIFVTYLDKGPMVLTLTYKTAASFSNFSTDEDLLSLKANILYDPSEEVD